MGDDINADIANQGRVARAQAARRELILARDSQKVGSLGDEAREKLAKRDEIRVAINSPHKATARGNQIAITINSPETKSNNQSSTTQPFQAIIISATGTLQFKVLGSVINAAAIADTTFTVAASGYILAHIHDNATTYVEDTWEIIAAATVTVAGEHDGYEPIVSFIVSGGVLTVENLRYGPVFHVNTTGAEHQFG